MQGPACSYSYLTFPPTSSLWSPQGPAERQCGGRKGCRPNGRTWRAQASRTGFGQKSQGGVGSALALEGSLPLWPWVNLGSKGLAGPAPKQRLGALKSSVCSIPPIRLSSPWREPPLPTTPCCRWAWGSAGFRSPRQRPVRQPPQLLRNLEADGRVPGFGA